MESLSLNTVLCSANKLGLLTENQEESAAFNKGVNQALRIIHTLKNDSYCQKGSNPSELTIATLNQLTGISPLTLSNTLEILIKLEIVRTTNGYYYLTRS